MLHRQPSLCQDCTGLNPSPSPGVVTSCCVSVLASAFMVLSRLLSTTRRSTRAMVKPVARESCRTQHITAQHQLMQLLRSQPLHGPEQAWSPLEGANVAHGVTSCRIQHHTTIMPGTTRVCSGWWAAHPLKGDVNMRSPLHHVCATLLHAPCMLASYLKMPLTTKRHIALLHWRIAGCLQPLLPLLPQTVTPGLTM